MAYAKKIASIVPELDPRHVEAFMRVEHPTLDALSPQQFEAEARIAAQCVADAGLDMSETLARSFWL